MREIVIEKNEAGQRLDKFLAKYMNEASKSFFYKMMRKKNITLNGKKCEGNEKLAEGDVVKLFLAEDTIEKFSSVQVQEVKKVDLDILYEDDEIILVNKPAGMLSQKAKETDESLVEYLIDYLLGSGKLTESGLRAFRPSVCNRLDRNTSGIVICGKSMIGLQRMAELLQDRSLHKYYLCLIHGAMKEGQRLEGWLRKDEKSNQVEILKAPVEDAAQIITEYEPMKVSSEATLLKVKLVTGKPHQIRAHLASVGHPIIGDPKYGDMKINEYYRKEFKLNRQLLHAWRLEFPELAAPLTDLSQKVVEAPVPELMNKIMQKVM